MFPTDRPCKKRPTLNIFRAGFLESWTHPPSRPPQKKFYQRNLFSGDHSLPETLIFFIWSNWKKNTHIILFLFCFNIIKKGVPNNSFNVRWNMYHWLISLRIFDHHYICAKSQEIIFIGILALSGYYIIILRWEWKILQIPTRTPSGTPNSRTFCLVCFGAGVLLRLF